jgi:hypothetical protein
MAYFFVAFFSATIDGRNPIFCHKLHIGTPYRGKHFWTHQIPTSCLPTCTYMKFVTKYQIPVINSFWEKCDEKCAYMLNVYKSQLSLQYMVICAFENSPSILSFLETQKVYIRYGQILKKWLFFSFYLFITLLLVFLYPHSPEGTCLYLIPKRTEIYNKTSNVIFCEILFLEISFHDFY